MFLVSFSLKDQLNVNAQQPYFLLLLTGLSFMVYYYYLPQVMQQSLLLGSTFTSGSFHPIRL